MSSLKEYMKTLGFVHSKNFAVLAPGDQLILKDIFIEEESEESNEFHVSQIFST